MSDHNLNELEEAVTRLYETARRRISQLEWQIAAQRRYISALEGQLAPEVVEEIQVELSAREQEEKN